MEDTLTPEDIYEVLNQAFPEQNDFFPSNYKEELEELVYFGITSKLQLLDLISKHKETVLEIDEEPLDEEHIKWYSDDYGKDCVEERVKNNSWFAYPGLLRITLDLEFGEKYKEFARKRDNLLILE